MTFTDKEAVKELNRARSFELHCRIEDYPEYEREGRSDFQILADELSWLLDNFNEDGHCLHDDLEDAREILRETKNGKVIPLWKDSLKPMYSSSRIKGCRDIVNEYNRLVSLRKRVHAKGYKGRWE